MAVVARRLPRPTPRSPTSIASRCAARGRGRSAASPTTRRRPSARARELGARVRRRRAPSGWTRFAAERGAPGLLVFAIDTELLGHWWWEGPAWLDEVLAAAAGARDRAGHAGARRAERHAAEERPLRRSSWGEGKDLRTWDSPAVADMAWAARRLELRVLRGARGRRAARAAAERAARELLAVQASDWAFLDRRGQAGDYPWQRSTGHARALLEAINSAAHAPDPRLRNLAPDLSLSPLLEP